MDLDGIIYIAAWKKVGDGSHTHCCKIDDPDAHEYVIHHPNQSHPCSTIKVESRYLAERITNALKRAFHAGMQEDKKQLREFLNIN